MLLGRKVHARREDPIAIVIERGSPDPGFESARPAQTRQLLPGLRVPQPGGSVFISVVTARRSPMIDPMPVGHHPLAIWAKASGHHAGRVALQLMEEFAVFDRVDASGVISRCGDNSPAVRAESRRNNGRFMASERCDVLTRLGVVDL